MELLAKHKGSAASKPNNRLLLLLGAVVCSILAVTFLRGAEVPAAPAESPPAPAQDEAAAVSAGPVRKRAAGPSRGARRAKA